jgi:pyruvate/2-oxoglutarate dehydrogenase complex dihydrolipoamide acyltransferase (E2) component
LHMAVGVGEKIHVGEVLVVIGEAGERQSSAASASVSVVGSLDMVTTELPPSPEVAQAARAVSSTQPSRVLAIPSVRKLARDLGVELTQITPTGPHGRIRRMCSTLLGSTLCRRPLLRQHPL